MANNFQYNPLSAPGALRLLKVLPGKLDEQIQIHLWEATETVPYRCLSYMWGDQAEQLPILVNGSQMSIGRNLYTFLEIARQRFSDETLWIDALCINQSNNTEKSLQVQRMGKIFSEAKEVLVWLGCNEVIAELFTWTSQSREGVKLELDLSPPGMTLAHLMRALVELSTNPFWDRAWITQEVMLSQCLRLLCGTTETRPHALQACHKLMLELPTDQRYTWEALKARVWLEGTLGLLVKEIWWYMPTDLFSLAYKRKDAKCVDPRDKLYSLLAIIGHDGAFRVDYDESAAGLFMRSLLYFQAWMEMRVMAALWDLLGLQRISFLRQIQDEPEHAWLGIPLHHHQDQLADDSLANSSASSGQRTGASTHQIASLETEHIFLSPKPSDDAFDPKDTYLVIKPSSPGSAAPFAISLHCGLSGGLLCPDDTELWRNANDEPQKLSTWDELVNLTLEQGERDGEEGHPMAKPCFLVKLSHVYVLESIALAKRVEEVS